MFEGIDSAHIMRAIVAIPELPDDMRTKAQTRLQFLEERDAKLNQTWNSARQLAAILKSQTNFRWTYGYTENEAARGVDEQESYEWEELRKRIAFLRKRSLRRYVAQVRF